MKPPSALLCLGVAAMLTTACGTTMDRASREWHWMHVLADEVPVGTPRATAEQILTARGLQVLYMPYAHLGERPDECPAGRLYAAEYGKVRGLGARPDVRLILCLDGEQRVSRTEVDLLNALI